MLLAGMESNNRVGLLLKLTKIKSENVIAAIYDNLCRGITAESSAALNEITPGQLSRALEIMETVNKIVEEIKEDDYKHL